MPFRTLTILSLARKEKASTQIMIIVRTLKWHATALYGFSPDYILRKSIDHLEKKPDFHKNQSVTIPRSERLVHDR